MSIKGYKQLTDMQITDINVVKDLEAAFLNHLRVLFEYPSVDIDKRWISIARSHIEQASMAAVRAITKPDTVEF
jgi:hypothetical protein